MCVCVQQNSDRIRTTNNMLGDCYAAAVVEQLSKKELMALDAAILYQDTPVTPNGNGHTLTLTVNGGGMNGTQTDFGMPEAMIVNEMNGGLTIMPGSAATAAATASAAAMTGGTGAAALVAATHGRLNGTGQPSLRK